jgi:4-amino-4-deoxy-L-arabinose transferase-like glycosyltransferase
LLAAVLRFPALATRGAWDADQGHDMLILTAFVRDGIWPLLGPPTSIGDFHHGALYYYLLAPAAWLGSGDPAVVVGEIALLGVAAVALVAAVARSVAGPLAGVIAGLLMALSASAIDESTFLWNPNLVAFTSALAVAAAWRAWSTRHVRWWLLVAAAQAATMQCHVLGVVLLPPLALWLAADARRRTGRERRTAAGSAVAALAIVATSYVPLLVSELQTNFHESRAAVDFLTGGGQAVAAGPLLRIVFVSLRILAWPLTGLLTSGLAPGIAAGVGVTAVVAWRWRTADQRERPLVRWIGATMAWSCASLGLFVAGLATVTPLPVDHYHAFLDPIVFIVVGLGAAALWRSTARIGAAARPAAQAAIRGLPASLPAGRVATVLIVGLLAAWNVTHMPPPVAADGGYPAAESAARRIATTVGQRGTLVASLPTFKSAEAYLYPLRESGTDASGQLIDAFGLRSVVVVCDALFVADCGGPAEDRLSADYGTAGAGNLRLADRFVAAPGRTISVYLATSP